GAGVARLPDQRGGGLQILRRVDVAPGALQRDAEQPSTPPGRFEERLHELRRTWWDRVEDGRTQGVAPGRRPPPSLVGHCPADLVRCFALNPEPERITEVDGDQTDDDLGLAMP